MPFTSSILSVLEFQLDLYRCCSVIQLCLALTTPWTTSHQAFLSLTISQSLPKFMSSALVMPSSHLILWCHLVLLSSIFPIIRVFSNELGVRIRWPKYWSFSISISHSSEYSGLISFKSDWFDFLVIQGTLQESSSAPQFKEINSLVLYLLYGPALTTIGDYLEKP